MTDFDRKLEELRKQCLDAIQETATLRNQVAQMKYEHGQRVTELLAANNAELERRRAAEKLASHLEDEIANGRALRDALRDDLFALVRFVRESGLELNEFLQDIVDRCNTASFFADWTPEQIAAFNALTPEQIRAMREGSRG
jgi:septal ring factor EnvC (AmiA/AmiB activator)